MDVGGKRAQLVSKNVLISCVDRRRQLLMPRFCIFNCTAHLSQTPKRRHQENHQGEPIMGPIVNSFYHGLEFHYTHQVAFQNFFFATKLPSN